MVTSLFRAKLGDFMRFYEFCTSLEENKILRRMDQRINKQRQFNKIMKGIDSDEEDSDFEKQFYDIMDVPEVPDDDEDDPDIMVDIDDDSS